MTTIAGGYVKAQVWGARQVLMTEQGSQITVPTMLFGGGEGPHFTSLHNDSSGRDESGQCHCPKNSNRHQNLGGHHQLGMFKETQVSGERDRSPGSPYLGEQEVNPIGIIRLPLRFGDKTKARNPKVDFLVVDVPMAYNVIPGRPTLLKSCLYLPAESSYLWHSACRSRIRPSRTEIKGVDPTNFSTEQVPSKTLCRVSQREHKLSAPRTVNAGTTPQSPCLWKEGAKPLEGYGQKQRPCPGPPPCIGAYAYLPEGGSPISQEASGYAMPTLALWPILSRKKKASPVLALHKTKESPLRIILKDKKASGSKEKYDSLGSQLKGSLSLDLIRLRSSSLPVSTI
ncbi:LOW QUALITY PROTEIN: hypothetical protein Cgig2_030075 [Carnegiea gigantea]|uniref:Uncharacterized protein n=1 Tax=Carnegiea gigantea TaxID=171969 RepID=A0A9Q1JYY7_9CARY|nr:LOW QUALITY PROTEIN: hypothetical protein Cgig2_030075 [Carnegiea gigantea]